MKLFQKQKEVPEKKDVERMIDQADETIADNDEEKEQFAKMVEAAMMNSWLAGEKTASIQGTKRDKMFLMMIINSGMTVMVVGLLAYQMFM